MENENVNKVIYGDEVLIDLTSDTVTPETILSGVTAHDASGKIITGTCNFDVNSQDATAAVAEILKGKTAYVRGTKLTGTMPNNGAVSGNISTKDGVYTVPNGFHDGSGKVQIASTEKSKLIPENIREGITVLGVPGAMTGTEDAKPQAFEVTPTINQQVILPDSNKGYNYISQVTVKPIPVLFVENEAGGMTATIGGIINSTIIDVTNGSAS